MVITRVMTVTWERTDRQDWCGTTDNTLFWMLDVLSWYALFKWQWNNAGWARPLKGYKWRSKITLGWI